MSEDFNWRCPHCHHDVTISEERHSHQRHTLTIQNADGRRSLLTTFVVCPNPECKRFTLSASLWHSSRPPTAAQEVFGEMIEKWRLMPSSMAKAYDSNIVPAVILSDYEEAAAIVDLSPKASATLSRRCLQGILRDFWKAKPGRLVDEIDEIKSKIDGVTWNAIDGVRKLGNIGAHMEKDINVIVDVDPNESALLVSLVETLIEEWYIGRAEREARMNSIIAAAASKKPNP